MDSYSFDIGGELFGVRTTSRNFGRWIKDNFSSYIVEQEADAYLSIVVEEDSVRSSIRKKSILYRGTTSIMSTVHVPTIALAFMSQLEFFLMAERRSALLATAAPAVANGRHVLIPTLWTWGLHGLASMGRRTGVILPAAHAVWIDESGTVLPAKGLLDIPNDALERLGEYIPGNGALERLVVTEPMKMDAVLVRSQNARWGDPGLMLPASRAYTVYTLASEIVETDDIEWQSALESLAHLVDGSRCYAINSWRPEDVLAAISSAG